MKNLKGRNVRAVLHRKELHFVVDDDKVDVILAVINKK